MSKGQRALVEDRFEAMKRAPRKRHVFHEGEKTELKDGCVFDVLSVDDDTITVSVIQTGEGNSVGEGDVSVFANTFDDDDIMKVNDELFDNGNDLFPSEYSKTSVEEFFSECFAYWRAHELCRSLSSFMKNVFKLEDRQPSEKK
jgi:hypothetical protein